MNKLLKLSFLLLFFAFIACKTNYHIKSEKAYLFQSESKFLNNKLYHLFSRNQSLANEYERKGVLVTFENEIKNMKLDKLIFQLAASSYYDLENQKTIKSKESKTKPFFIKLYEIDNTKKVTEKLIYNENIEVKVNYQNNIASVDLSKINIEIPKNGFFIEFCSNLEKEIIKFEYSNYPSILKEKVINFNNFQPMAMKLFRKEKAYWEKDDFLISRNENYIIKLLFEKNSF